MHDWRGETHTSVPHTCTHTDNIHIYSGAYTFPQFFSNKSHWGTCLSTGEMG